MNLIQRYKHLSFWNKLAVCGAIASIVGLPIAILSFHYGSSEEKIQAREEGKPKFVLNLGNARFGKSQEKASVMFIEIEIMNLGSPSVVIGWQAELKLDSQTTSRILPTSITDGLKILRDDGKLMAEFHKDNLLENKAIEEPLVKGARVSGWLMFNFTDITQEQLANAEKTIYVHDILNHEYSLKFSAKDLSTTGDIHFPGAGTPPFMP
jgi:hypothetical protein